jgi:hypothetical protein
MSEFKKAITDVRGAVDPGWLPGRVCGGGIIRDNPEYNKIISSIVALGRPGKPHDIGKTLQSDNNHWINAQRIPLRYRLD